MHEFLASDLKERSPFCPDSSAIQYRSSYRAHLSSAPSAPRYATIAFNPSKTRSIPWHLRVAPTVKIATRSAAQSDPGLSARATDDSAETDLDKATSTARMGDKKNPGVNDLDAIGSSTNTILSDGPGLKLSGRHCHGSNRGVADSLNRRPHALALWFE
jgi:hypothetical protein